MAVTIQLRRDTNDNLQTVTAAEGELLVATDTGECAIGTGSLTFAQLQSANKTFFYQDGEGRVLGGNNANETIAIRGNSTQTSPIFKVVNSSDQSIVEVTDNDTQLVKIDSTNADVGDINLLLKAKASQTGEVIVVTDSDDVKNFTVKEDGQTLIDPNDTTDPSLKVVGSGGSQSNGILRVEDTGNNAEFVVSDGGATVAGTLGVGGTLGVTGETTATGGIKVDDITEATADHGIDFAKPISVTGNIIGTANLVIPHQPCQTRITQTDTIETHNLNANSDATAISFTKVNAMEVSITPAVANSKILIEVSMQCGDQAEGSSLDQPESLLGTLFRRVGSGSDVDLSATNVSGTVKGLFFCCAQRHTSRTSTPGSLQILGQHLDSPSYSLGDQLTYAVGVASCRISGGGVSFRLNSHTSSSHDAQAVSLIKVTEIPQ